jgi:hypothetical protein
MTTEEQLKELVNESEFPQLQKELMNGFIDRAKAAQEKMREDRQLIKEVAYEKKLSEVVLSTDEVKIYTVSGTDEWDVKYPFRSIYLTKNNAWRKSNTVSPNLDLAFLVYLQYKHLGLNSQFTDFAMKMLEIKIEE